MTTEIDSFEERCTRILAAAIREHDTTAAESDGPREPFTLTLSAVKRLAKDETTLRIMERAMYLPDGPPDPTTKTTEEKTTMTKTKTPRAVEAFTLSAAELAELDPLERAAVKLIQADESLPDAERLPTKAKQTAARMAESARRLARERVMIEGKGGNVEELAEQLLLEHRTGENLRAAESLAKKRHAAREDATAAIGDDLVRYV